jgi:hypothetical protein
VQTRTVMRNELYAMVWSTPMRRLAKEFGVSDVGLAKTCHKNDIPTPPLGYWAKKEHGNAVRQTPLPAAKSDTETAITITEQPAYPSEPPTPAQPVVQHPKIAALIADAEKPENKVVVTESPHGSHPLVTAARKGFADAKPGTYGLLHPDAVDGKGCLNLKISKGAIERALRLMDAFLKALDRHGFMASYTDDARRNELLLTLSICVLSSTFALMQPDSPRESGFSRRFYFRCHAGASTKPLA